jgi:hypothetical protein
MWVIVLGPDAISSDVTARSLEQFLELGQPLGRKVVLDPLITIALRTMDPRKSLKLGDDSAGKRSKSALTIE